MQSGGRRQGPFLKGGSSTKADLNHRWSLCGTGERMLLIFLLLLLFKELFMCFSYFCDYKNNMLTFQNSENQEGRNIKKNNTPIFSPEINTFMTSGVSSAGRGKRWEVMSTGSGCQPPRPCHSLV